jgi:hypothetical protein
MEKLKRWINIKKELQESSLSRIWQHIVNPETSFAVISAFREEFSEEENLKRHEKLKQQIRSLGYGLIEQKSGYSYEDNKNVIVDEKSFFIPNIDFVSALKLGNLFKNNLPQESILYKSPDKDFGVYSCKSGKILVHLKNKDHLFTFSKEEVKKAYSQLIRANKSQRIKFAYIMEYYIPSMTDAYKSIKEKELPKARWIEFV